MVLVRWDEEVSGVTVKMRVIYKEKEAKKTRL